MSSSGTAREALLAEALGDIAKLMDRLDATVPALEQARQDLVRSNKDLAQEVAFFKTQLTQAIGVAKVESVNYINARADEVTRKLIAIQIRSMQAAGRELFRAEFEPAVKRVVEQLNRLHQLHELERMRAEKAQHWERWLAHAAAFNLGVMVAMTWRIWW